MSDHTSSEEKVLFGSRARIGFISPSVIELRGYDFYRIVPKGVGMIAVTCMVEGWKDDAYKDALGKVEDCARRTEPTILRFCRSCRSAAGSVPREGLRVPSDRNTSRDNGCAVYDRDCRGHGGI